MCEVDLIIIKFEGVCESKGVVVSCEAEILFLIIVLEIRNVSTNSMPTHILLFLEAD